MIGSLLGKIGWGAMSSLQKYALGGIAVIMLASMAFGAWQYKAHQAARADAIEARIAADSANATIDVLRQQRDEDIESLRELQQRLSDTRDELVRATDDLNQFRGPDNEAYIQSNPDVADQLINDRADRLFRELACETGSRADCPDSSAGPDTTDEAEDRIRRPDPVED